jgi:hypothetical protein
MFKKNVILRLPLGDRNMSVCRGSWVRIRHFLHLLPSFPFPFYSAPLISSPVILSFPLIATPGHIPPITLEFPQFLSQEEFRSTEETTTTERNMAIRI